jgi:hypothetical protein
MKAKNNSSLRLFALFFAIALPCQSLLSSYRSPNSPYPAPRKKYAQKSPRPASRQPQSTLPTNTDAELKKEMPDTKKVTPEPQPQPQVEPQLQPQVEPEAETDVVTNTKEIQTAEQTAEPGMLTKIYLSLVPLFLHSLNSGLDNGIAAVSKTLIKQFGQRHAFNQLNAEAIDLVKSGTFDTQLTPEGQKMPEKEKIKLSQDLFFKKRKMDFKDLEEQTSLSHIIGQTIYTGMLYTTVYMFGKLMTIIAPMGLQTLMPKQYKQ